MLARLGIVEEEADESLYWMELLVETNAVPFVAVQPVSELGDSILRMTVSSIKTIRQRIANSKSNVREEIAVYMSDEDYICESDLAAGHPNPQSTNHNPQ
jgi:hypothetical protein